MIVSHSTLAELMKLPKEQCRKEVGIAIVKWVKTTIDTIEDPVLKYELLVVADLMLKGME